MALILKRSKSETWNKTIKRRWLKQRHCFMKYNQHQESWGRPDKRGYKGSDELSEKNCMTN